MEHLIRRFERELRRRGEAGERALVLWAKRRPSCEAGVADATPGERKGLAVELVRVAGEVAVSDAVELALVVVWDDLAGHVRRRLEWVPMMGPGCAAAEVLRGVWSDGPGAVPSCSCEEDHGEG